MKNTLLKIGSRVAILPVLLLPASAYAQLAPLPSTLNPGGSTKDLPTLIGQLINAVLGVVGIVFVVLVVYAGVLYMTAQGEAGKVEKAKTMLTQAVIGIVIIVLAYSISSFVINAIQGATV